MISKPSIDTRIFANAVLKTPIANPVSPCDSPLIEKLADSCQIGMDIIRGPGVDDAPPDLPAAVRAFYFSAFNVDLAPEISSAIQPRTLELAARRLALDVSPVCDCIVRGLDQAILRLKGLPHDRSPHSIHERALSVLAILAKNGSELAQTTFLAHARDTIDRAAKRAWADYKYRLNVRPVCNARIFSTQVCFEIEKEILDALPSFSFQPHPTCATVVGWCFRIADRHARRLLERTYAEPRHGESHELPHAIATNLSPLAPLISQEWVVTHVAKLGVDEVMLAMHILGNNSGYPDGWDDKRKRRARRALQRHLPEPTDEGRDA